MKSTTICSRYLTQLIVIAQSMSARILLTWRSDDDKVEIDRQEIVEKTRLAELDRLAVGKDTAEIVRNQTAEQEQNQKGETSKKLQDDLWA